MAVHQDLLLANCLAQGEALMKGRSLEAARRQLIDAGKSETIAEAIATLGRLIALYEHRVFVEAQLFGINAFDQWGVELGKELAGNLVPVVTGQTDSSGLDASTRGLVAAIQTMRRT